MILSELHDILYQSSRSESSTFAHKSALGFARFIFEKVYLFFFFMCLEFEIIFNLDENELVHIVYSIELTDSGWLPRKM